MRPLLAVVIRVLAFVGKELTETIRRPGAIVSLVLGPFLIMAVFGLGYSGIKRPLETIVVIPESSGLSADPARYQELAGGGLHVAGVTPDRAAAEAQLTGGAVDVVIVAPDDPQASFRAGEQSVIEVLIDVVDPIAANYAGFLASGLASAVNREIIREAASESQGYAVAAGEPDAADIPPDVVAAPTRAELVNTAPSEPAVLAYFGPAVLALILQHLAVTLVALSLVRERTSGVIELFRVAPVSATEVLIGKVLAFSLLGGAIGALTVALLVGVFHVPMLSDPAPVALVIGLVLVASLGLGLLIAVISDSERQAVQLSLLVLLASVFFSGFVLSIDEFTEPVRALAYTLPVTHGIRLLQDFMLRGTTTEAWELLALVVIALVTLVASWLLLRRGMTRA
ncbi:MAG TPA: ABC transporter permease [Candidatus Limnocylindrales bacterium]